MLTANKGEWSELYALLRIFDKRQISAADENLAPIAGQSYTFVKIFREDTPGEKLEYNLERSGSVVIYDSSGKTEKIIDTCDLGTKTMGILDSIIKGSDVCSFRIPLAEEMMDQYLLEKIKARSSEKSDIVAVILDRITDTRPELGFSVKSQLGGPSTLLNASSKTNFIYRVKNFDGDINDINSISGKSKVRDRIKALMSRGASLEFESTSSLVFNSNLRFVDSSFPEIIAEMLLGYYSGVAKYIPDLCKFAGEKKIVGMDESEISFKTKEFLRIIALGMVPGTPWSTYMSSYGGYLVVKDDGDVVCYHLYNYDKFKDYLYNNTRFETPSTTRHGFGKLYEENGDLKFKLNLQIRFN